MKAIVNVDNNWGIGNEGGLLFHIPEDLKFFKRKTIGNVIIMGRKTFLSLPGSKALCDRVNIVITGDEAFSAPDVIVCHSVEELFEVLKRFDTNTVYVCGGESVYEQLLPYCDTVYVTKVDSSAPADKFFPDLDNEENWVLAKESETFDFKGLNYKFITYKSV